MYLHLVSFSTIAFSLTLGLDKINEKFVIVYNNSMIDPLVDIPTNLDKEIKEDIFYTMSEDDRIKLCNEAKDFAGLDIGVTITNAPLKYRVMFQKILVECKTIPISYLCKWGHPNEISIAMKENEFFKYPFEVQITESEPILYSISTRTRETTFMDMSLSDFLKEVRSTNFENDLISNRIRVSGKMTLDDFLAIIGATTFYNKRVNDNRISQLKEEEPIQLCWAAKQHLRKLADDNNNVKKVPIFQSDRIEPAEIFDFGNEIGDHVALHCPSTPSMYVYFINLTVDLKSDFYLNKIYGITTPNLVQIVLVQN